MGAHGTNNKQQTMCSTHRDIWWPARAHQQDRDIIELLHFKRFECRYICSFYKYDTNIFTQTLINQKICWPVFDFFGRCKKWGLKALNLGLSYLFYKGPPTWSSKSNGEALFTLRWQIFLQGDIPLRSSTLYRTCDKTCQAFRDEREEEWERKSWGWQ